MVVVVVVVKVVVVVTNSVQPLCPVVHVEQKETVEQRANSMQFSGGVCWASSNV